MRQILGEVPQTVTDNFPYHPLTTLEVAVEVVENFFAVFHCIASSIDGSSGKWRMREGSCHGGGVVSFYRVVSAYEELEK